MSYVGIIGGSGLYEVPGLINKGEREVETPFGEPSAPYLESELSGVGVYFLQRHGRGHAVAPHMINYRANIRGFKDLGVERIISVNATGSISASLKPGDIVLLDQVIDMTLGSRKSTFFESGEVVHVDFTEPYCPELSTALAVGAERAGVPIRPSGTYLCVNGPRLESRAEISFFARMGADVVGMTGMPEAALAREAEICFTSVSVVTNYAAGLSGKRLTTSEVVGKMRESNGLIRAILAEALPAVPQKRGCACGHALRDTRM